MIDIDQPYFKYSVDLWTKYKIILPDGSIHQKMIEWCDENCKDSWDDPMELKFVFRNNDDAILFKIIWG